MRRAAIAATVAAGLLVTAPRGAHGFAGVGRDAVERAGEVPESKDALEAEIDRLEGLIEGADASAETAYRAAILVLNKPKTVELDHPRRLLSRAVLLDPGYEDALHVWMSLNPTPNELRQVGPLFEMRMRDAPGDAALLWAHARVLHRAGDHGAAVSALDRVEQADPAYLGRAAWLRATLAAEKEREDLTTRYFEDALANLDEETAKMAWWDSRLVATPQEVARWETTPEEDRATFFRSFWKRRDVLPLSVENERLAEHFQRLEEARNKYALKTNGRGYMTMHDVFKDLSPDLYFYSADLTFDYMQQAQPWIDHRGLVYVRHGVADRGTRSTIGTRSETWLYYRWTNKPLLFHFVDRRGVSEFVAVLNLAQAAANSAIEDDPEQVIGYTNDFRELYSTRATFDTLYQRMATARTSATVEELLRQEAVALAGFLGDSWNDDTSNLIKKDDLLPFAAYSANFRADEETVDTYVYYAVPERELKELGPQFEFDATVVVYDDEWKEQVATAEHHFRYERPAGRKPSKDDLLVGALEMKNLEPGRYNFAFQLRERTSGKVGVAKGRMTVDYYGPGWVDVSDLLLAQRVEPTDRATLFERNGHQVIPIPTRSLKRGTPGKIYYEIYDLEAGADGKNHYRVEYRVLQIQQKPGLASKLFGIGMNIAYLFFPYQTFLAQAGLFGLDVATADPDEGLDTVVEERNVTPIDGVVSEIFELDTKEYKPGVYQVYVTVKDHVSGSLSTKSMRIAVN